MRNNTEQEGEGSEDDDDDGRKDDNDYDDGDGYNNGQNYHNNENNDSNRNINYGNCNSNTNNDDDDDSERNTKNNKSQMNDKNSSDNNSSGNGLNTSTPPMTLGSAPFPPKGGCCPSIKDDTEGSKVTTILTDPQSTALVTHPQSSLNYTSLKDASLDYNSNTKNYAPSSSTPSKGEVLLLNNNTPMEDIGASNVKSNLLPLEDDHDASNSSSTPFKDLPSSILLPPSLLLRLLTPPSQSKSNIESIDQGSGGVKSPSWHKREILK